MKLSRNKVNPADRCAPAYFFVEWRDYAPLNGELLRRRLGEKDAKPYRIIYRVLDKNVYVLLITDGRRDMQTLLQRRLLYG